MMPAFPLHWDYRRVFEVMIALYSSHTGAVFMWFPDTLSRPVYRYFGAATEDSYLLGLLLMLTALLHVWALVLNGTSRRLSIPIRKIACYSHLFLYGSFTVNFILVGAYWPVVTMVMVVAMIYFALHRAYYPGVSANGV